MMMHDNTSMNIETSHEESNIKPKSRQMDMRITVRRKWRRNGIWRLRLLSTCKRRMIILNCGK
jgi:hypothetical protein